MTLARNDNTPHKEKNQRDNTFYDLWEDVKDKIDEEKEILIDEEEQLSDDILVDEEPGVYNWKIVLIGDGAVGKTSLRKRYLGEEFTEFYQQTIGSDFSIHKDQIGSNQVKFVIWDLAGQPRFFEVRRSFYRGCDGALIVCDVSNPDSFNNIKDWINEFWISNDKGPVPFIVVANKIDLQDLGLRTLSTIKVKNLAAVVNSETLKKYGFGIKSIITSAKTGENVIKAFKMLGIQIIAYNRFMESKYKKIYSQSE